MINWRDLPYFLALARCGTLSAAGAMLEVAPSTIGRRVTALETSAGARLLTRTPEGFRVTQAGATLLETAESLERNLRSTERRLSDADARVAGVVRVAVSESFAVGFIGPRVLVLRERHPALTLNLVIGNRAHDLSRGEADLAIRIMPRPRQSNVVTRRIGWTSMALYCSHAYLARCGRSPLDDSMAGHDVVTYGGDLSALTREWLDTDAKAASVALVSESLLAATACVAAGMGVGLLPCYLAEPDTRLIRLGHTEIGTRGIWLIVHSDLRHRAAVRAVAEFLRESCASEPGLLTGGREIRDEPRASRR